MARLWLSGERIQVETNADSIPLAFVLQGQRHVIESIVQSWRVDTDWWTPVRLWREHFQVVTATGLMVIIYRDLTRNEWRLQRLYD